MPIDLDAVRERWPAWPIHYFPVIDSTMHEAARLAAANAPHGTVVLADGQTAGIGRFGRTWHSEPDQGIYCSVVLRLEIPAAQLPVATLMLGLATAEAIQSVTNVACDLRWPNDVLINGRKTAGILAQLADRCIVAGIGINVNQLHLPLNLRTPGTSIRIESSGHLQSRENILAALLESLDAFSRMLQYEGAPVILKAFAAASSYAKNRRVIVEEGGRTGTTAGIDANGFLLVRFDTGTLERVAAGGVRPAE